MGMDRPRYGSVLIIEDDPSVSILLRENLKKAGFDVEQAYSAADARTVLERRRFNFVICDIYLGDDTGENIIAGLRGRAGLNQGVPILVMSSRPDAELIRRISQQVSAILVKPLSFEKIIAMLKRMVFSPELATVPATVLARSKPTPGRKAA